MSTVKITVNGKQIEADTRKNLLSVLKENGMIIPSLCHDGISSMDIPGCCGLCLVEIDEKLARACETTPSEGMNILTQSESIIMAQQSALSILYANHFRYNGYVSESSLNQLPPVEMNLTSSNTWPIQIAV